jgi:hypothetical protein
LLFLDSKPLQVAELEAFYVVQQKWSGLCPRLQLDAGGRKEGGDA